MVDLGELRARITADIAELEKAMDSSVGKVEEFGEKTEKSSKRANTGIKSIDRALKALSNPLALAATGAGAVAAAMVAMTAAGLSAADEHAKLARQLGLSNQELAVMKRAADLSGVSVGELRSNTERLNRAIVDAEKGTGPATEAFEKLGIAAEDIKDLDMQQQLEVLGEAISNVGSRAERSAIAQDIFGRSGSRMLLLLEDAEGTFARATREVDQFGLALSEVDTDAIEAANDNISTLKEGLGSAAQQMAAVFAPAIVSVTDKMIGFLGSVISSRNEVLELIKAKNRLGTEEEQEEDRLKVLIAQRDAYEKQIREGSVSQQIRARQNIDAVNQEIAAERERLRFAQLAARYEEQANKEKAEQAKRDAEAAAKRADDARQLTEWLDRVNQMYAQTTEGKLEAIDAEIAWFENAQKEAVKTKAMFEPILSMLREQRELLAGGDGKKGGDDEPQFTDDLDRIRRSLMSERELMEQGLLEQLDILNDALEARELGWIEHYETVEELTKRHNDKLNDIEEEAAEARRRIAEAERQAKLNLASGFFGNLSTLMTTENKRLFEIGKVAAISQAVIDGISATLSAYKEGNKIGGPIVGSAYAASAAVATGAMVNQIRNQQYGGGGGTSAPPASVTSPEPQVQRTLLVQGDFDSGQLFTGDAVRNLMDRISEASRDGYQVVTA